MKRVEWQSFTRDCVRSLKENRSIYVVFSTLGEREADLVSQKISLLLDTTADLVTKIIVAHRKQKEELDRTEQAVAAFHKGVELFVCNSYHVPDMGSESGKGADMRRVLHHINSRNESSPEDIVVFLDADVLPNYFGEHFVLALAGAVLSGVDFAKAGFWREMGRLKKFVAQPLFSLFRHPSLDLLTNLTYPLSGEVAATLDFFTSVEFWQMYGIETSMNIDASKSDFTVADVNLGGYDHEHHGDANIQVMSFGLMRVFFKKLVAEKIILLGEGTTISDTFSCTYIDSDFNRQEVDKEVKELTYQPLCYLE